MPADIDAIRERIALARSVFGALSAEQEDTLALLDEVDRLQAEVAAERAATVAYLRRPGVREHEATYAASEIEAGEHRRGGDRE